MEQNIKNMRMKKEKVKERKEEEEKIKHKKEIYHCFNLNDKT